jgi:hypothetical protein
MPVEDTAAVMADIAVPMPGTLADTPRRPMFEEETMALVFAAGVVTSLPDTLAATHAMQAAHIMPLAAVTGEVTGHIRTTDIRGSAWAIMAWAIAIHTMAITATVPVGGTIRITHIFLTDTDTGPI